MIIIRATKRLLTRLKQSPDDPPGPSSTLLGDWYATILPWRTGHVALLMSDHTLLPVLMPVAPSNTLIRRFPQALAAVLEQHQVPPDVIKPELDSSRDTYITGTNNNRSRIGSLNEFCFHADTIHRDQAGLGLLALSMRLAEMPCGPLYRRHVAPADELAALLRAPTGLDPGD